MRLIVCDPVCIQAYGHNVSALKYFSTAFVDLFSETIAICCRSLPREVVAEYGFVPHYRYYYQQFMPVAHCTDEPQAADMAGVYLDNHEAVATQDAQELLKKFAVTESDSIFFPSVDFYGAVGLLNALAPLQKQYRPRVMLRFIGVMESASHTYRDPVKELMRRISRSMKSGVRIHVSAETPRLADEMAWTLEVPVVATPYPTVATASPLPSNGLFTCFCPGSARHDKGFLYLHDLFSRVRMEDHDLQIRFVIQDLPAKDGANLQNYVSQLYALPGLELLPAQISSEQMESRYRQSSAVILPYDKTTYKYRGSAAMMEAVCFGRPVVALDGAAFSEQIRFYQLGMVCSTIEEMAQSILTMAKHPASYWTIRAMQSRSRFTADASESYFRWFREAR